MKKESNRKKKLHITIYKKNTGAITEFTKGMTVEQVGSLAEYNKNHDNIDKRRNKSNKIIDIKIMNYQNQQDYVYTGINFEATQWIKRFVGIFFYDLIYEEYNLRNRS